MSVWVPVIVAGIGAVATVSAALVQVAFQLLRLRQENTAQHAEGRALIQSAVDGIAELKAGQADQGDRLALVEQAVFGDDERKVS